MRPIGCFIRREEYRCCVHINCHNGSEIDESAIPGDLYDCFLGDFSLCAQAERKDGVGDCENACNNAQAKTCRNTDRGLILVCVNNTQSCKSGIPVKPRVE